MSARSAKIAVLLLAALAAPARADEKPPAWEPARTWAVMIGVLAWQKPGLGSFPKEGRVDRVLEKTLLARGVPAAQITFLEDDQATLDACRKALSKTAKAAGPGSTLIVYYAGHGTQEGGRTFFAPVDMDVEETTKTGLGVDDVGKTIAAEWKGSRLLLMADCCHSGALGRVVAGYADPKGPKAASLTSALASNLSTGAWTFTESVVSALEGSGRADLDGDGKVTFDEADALVRREMRFQAKQLTQAHRNAGFEGKTVLSTVDPARARKRVPGPWPIGDYVETEWKGAWYRARVLDADDARVSITYLGFEKGWDEWAPRARVRAPTPIAAVPSSKVEIEWKKTWWPGVIVDVRDDFAFVHYDGFGPEWDEWVTAPRLRPRGK